MLEGAGGRGIVVQFQRPDGSIDFLASSTANKE